MHSGQLYDDDSLIETAVRFATGGLDRGHALFVIATPLHAAALRRRLAAEGLDPAALAAAQRYVELDAEAVLATIVDGSVVEEGFERIVGRPVLAAAARCGGVAVFTEMISLLCAAGRFEVALRVEQCWSGLSGHAVLDLLCAYRLAHLAPGGGEAPPDAIGAARADYLALADPQHRRLVAMLLRHAQALDQELALRRTLQQHLTRSELELADFLENGIEPLHKLAADGTILWANRAELALLGYAEDEYVGRNIADFHVDPEVARECLRRVLVDEPLCEVPAQLRHKDGSIRHVSIRSNVFRLDGRFVHARCVSRDVTAQVQTEARLREELDAWEVLRRTGVALGSERDVERLMQTVTDAAVELTHARFGVLLHHNGDASPPQLWLRTAAGDAGDALADLPFSLSEEILSATLRDGRIVRREDLPRSAAADAAPATVRSYLAAPLTARSGQIRGGLFLVHAEAGVFTRRDELVVEGIAAQAVIAIDNARLFEANERSMKEQNTFNETLERRIVERTEALHRSEQQLDQLLSGIADYAIFLLDADGRVLTWNTGAERIAGYTAAEVIGENFTRFYTPDDRAAAMPQRALAIARAEGKYEAEGWRMRKDGSRFWASVLIDAIHDAGGEVVGFAKVTRDMTERRAIEEQLQQSQRMEAVGRMTGGVAHDFNNLLTIIIGNLDGICRETGLRPKVRTAAEHALRGAQRATALTQQLLAFSRRQTLNPQPTDINRLVAGTAELLKRTFGESIAIATELSGDLAACAVDAAQLESALINLAMNARDAMPTGGRLTISTANMRVDVPAVPVLLQDCVMIAVTDTGVGMSDDVRDHAFEPFFTTKPAGRGTGLGLSQVYGFVKQSGGLVRLHSEPGRGTTVTICLPRLDAEMPQVAEAKPAEAPGGSGTVLVVEDNEDVRSYGAGLLRELGFDVLEAADGESALTLFERHPEVRLLFTDVGLPGIDGVRLAEEARRERPDLKVLFTTGYAHHSLALSARPESGTGLLRKPYMHAQLAHGVRELLDADVATAEPLTALLVEDDAMLRDLTARLLERMRFEVVAADSVEAALRVLESGRCFDFALIDRLLGDGDGIVVARALRAGCPPTPVLLVTGYGDPEADDGGELPMETLHKPYGYDALADAIARLGVRVERPMPDRP
ncbi:PAS domain S-box protein [Dokdonella sp.]|uniref:PAS domain S-box protein n=1 Tax=Dokdonella sp. TaxID=2291710 RepID=UPI001B022873|nr:PAS domain S-box protein [Dokdonella sp.]MBO9662858.1 PAS domain S-box protein [Dokdonella sp.]